MAVTVSPPETKVVAGGLVNIQNTAVATSNKHLFVPPDSVWDLQSLHYKLVTSGDAADRLTAFRILDNNKVVQFTIDAAAVCTASSTEYYNAIMGGDTPLETVATFHFLPLPNPTLLLPGWELEVYQRTGSDDGTQSTGTLTIAEACIAGDPFTINGVLFTIVTALTGSTGITGFTANEILLGANEAATKTAINGALSTPTGYGTLHTVTDEVRQSLLVTAVDFTGGGANDDMVFLAVHAGTAYDSIDTTETFDGATNVWGGAVLASGADADDAGSLHVVVREFRV